MDAPLLTEAEHEFVELAGRVYAPARDEVVVDGPNRESDLNELQTWIHAIQTWAMSNAAARAFPDRYRLQGGTLSARP